MPSSRHWACIGYHLFWSSIDWVFPPDCGGCGKPGTRWCLDCQVTAVKIEEFPHCKRCGQGPLEGELCLTCRAEPPAYAAARSWAVYEGPIREAVHRLKYGRDLGLGEALAVHLRDLLFRLDWQVDLVTPVPLGIARFRERGYNQAAFIAFPLAMMANLPYSSKALQKVRNTRSQVELSLVERRANIRRAFQARPDLVAGRKILVVDDVMTSGATLNECAAALLEAGASQVYCLSFARAVHRAPESLHTP